MLHDEDTLTPILSVLLGLPRDPWPGLTCAATWALKVFGHAAINAIVRGRVEPVEPVEPFSGNF